MAFLSDGAFEEQRGSDWAPRWWRAEDCGFAIPVMILNGRRIEQRTQIVQEGGATWLAEDLRHNGFDPVIVDGRDPMAIAWAIVEAEDTLSAFAARSDRRYPVKLPYVIAETEKGFGFPGAATNAAHNLPLDGNPREDAQAREAFNAGAAALFVPETELENALTILANHGQSRRSRESEHPMARRHPASPQLPMPTWGPTEVSGSAMSALDRWFVELVQANPQLRIRIGNPDELASNKMGATLALLKHRVNVPEPGVPESADGAVITALNEEAVAGRRARQQGGLNLIVSYEAFAVKMLGMMRQEIIFARRQQELGQPPGWISVPLIVTSHTWENSKNEQSHQDPTIGEALLGEMSDTARVLFPVDAKHGVRRVASGLRQPRPSGLCGGLQARHAESLQCRRGSIADRAWSSPCSRRSVHRTTAIRSDWRLPVGGSAQSPCPPGAPWACVVHHRGGRARPSTHSARRT